MKITQIHTNKPQSLSFEIFPPKKEEDFKNIDEMLEILCDCHPEYISVTFGAGGSSNNNKTIEIAKNFLWQSVHEIMSLSWNSFFWSSVSAAPMLL